ncbi:MAG: phosphatidate cytidylyltransferase [Proteobacteria bacterium]|nr:phosphatidate cytidylyltransferase [Pseudomonadota bacterium]
MLFHRVLTAIVAIPILILYIWKGGSFMFATLICLVSFISLNEYYRIVFNLDGYPTRDREKAIPLIGYLSCAVIIFGANWDSTEIIVGMVVFNLLVAAAWAVFCYEAESNVLDTLARQIQGIIYVPLFLSTLVFIRNGKNGVTWIFFLLLIVAIGDTGAYFAGTYLGKNKLRPQVSPGKTIEGLIGALSAIVIVGCYFKYHLLPELPWIPGIFLFFVLGIAGVIGDLFESALKRAGHIKDSGTILPGHGGMLDRIDGLLFAAPVLYYFHKIFLG